MNSDWFHPTSIAAIIWIVTMIAGTIYQYLFLRNLKNNHSKIWKNAGSPTIFTDGDLSSAWSTVKYMRDREYKQINDSDGILYCNEKRLGLLFWFWAIALTVTVTLSLMFIIGTPESWN